MTALRSLRWLLSGSSVVVTVETADGIEQRIHVPAIPFWRRLAWVLGLGGRG